MLPTLGTAEVIIADSVTKYIIDNHDGVMLEGFGDVTPAYPTLFIESGFPGVRLLRQELDGVVATPFRKGALVVTSRNSLGWETRISQVFSAFNEWQQERIAVFPDQWAVSINPDGWITSVSEREREDSEIYSPVSLGSRHELRGDMATLDIVLTTLAFLNCKNVNVVSCAGDPSRQVRRRCEQTGTPLPPSIRYKVLEVLPIGNAKQRDDSEPGEAQRARHDCRGHFMHFGQKYGKGLMFGKYAGKYWVPNHQRGNVERGMIVKDYKVMASVA